MSKNRLVYQLGQVVDQSQKRSKFNRSFKHTTTFNTGQLIPVYLDEILPGDTCDINTNAVVRMSTPIKPTMDGSYVDVSYFFVPWRTIWDDFQLFMGENTDPYAVKKFPQIPQLKVPSGGVEPGTLLDYMGLPIGSISGLTISALPARAYVKIYNDWYRDENLQPALHLFKDSVDRDVNFGNDPVVSAELGGFPVKSSKYHDYFTSCLPSPQKGDPVSFNVLTPDNKGRIPVNTYPDLHKLPSDASSKPFDYSMIFVNPKTGSPYTDVKESTDFTVGFSTTPVPVDGKALRYPTNVQASYTDPWSGLTFGNLYADVGSTSFTINQLRQAITLQQYLEKDARGGTRYVEFLKTHFGVTSPDARLQRAEFLGGLHQPLDIHSVPQTSSTDTTSPQGNLSAFTATQVQHNGTVRKTFTEHGYLIGLATVRYEHTYQNGVNRLWSRKTRYDIYDPIFDNIGEQPVYTKEIYASTDTVSKNTIFGYNEAWADYRYKPNMVTGKMRSIKGGLDVWHYADNYTSMPVLGATWIQEDPSNVDRTLAIKSTGENAQPQVIADFYFSVSHERPMKVYSIPGLTRI